MISREKMVFLRLWASLLLKALDVIFGAIAFIIGILFLMFLTFGPGGVAIGAIVIAVTIALGIVTYFETQNKIEDNKRLMERLGRQP